MQNHTQLPTGLSFSYETERLILRLPSTDYLREIHDFYIVTAPALKNMNQPPLRIITHSISSRRSPGAS